MVLYCGEFREMLLKFKGKYEPYNIWVWKGMQKLKHITSFNGLKLPLYSTIHNEWRTAWMNYSKRKPLVRSRNSTMGMLYICQSKVAEFFIATFCQSDVDSMVYLFQDFAKALWLDSSILLQFRDKCSLESMPLKVAWLLNKCLKKPTMEECSIRIAAITASRFSVRPTWNWKNILVSCFSA